MVDYSSPSGEHNRAKSSLLYAMSPHLSSSFVFSESGREIRRILAVIFTLDAQKAEYGILGAELKVTTTMWPFCISWCGAAANEQSKPDNQLLLPGDTVMREAKDTPGQHKRVP